MSVLLRPIRAILGADGTPQPPTEVVRRLRQIDPRFDLMAAPDADAPGGDPSVWWVVQRWSERDARREMVRRQEVAPGDAYDLFCTIPRDCPVWEVPNYLMRRAERSAKPSVRAMMAELQRYNLDVQRATMDRATAEVEDRMEVQRHRLFNLPRVASAGIPAAPNGPAAPVAPVAPVATSRGRRKHAAKRRG